MAVFSPSESPAITVKEVDLSGYVPNVQSTTGAIVGDFRWGPAKIATKVGTEAQLAEVFGSPSSNYAVDFLSAAQFLRYSSSLFVVREITSVAKNATSSTSVVTNVNNKNHWDEVKSAFGADSGDTNVGAWIAKWAGTLGNSLQVSICAHSTSNTVFDAWAYKGEFDSAPGTSAYTSARSGSNDECHVVVIDQDGSISGTVGTVLERFAFLSLAGDAKTSDGSSNYALEVINSSSEYVWLAHWDGDLANLTNAGTNATGATFAASATAAVTKSLTGGLDSGILGTAEVATGFDLFEDTDTTQVDFLIAPGMTSAADQATVVNDLVGIAGTTRKDCIVVTSPNRAAVVNNSTAVADTLTTAATFNRSSYLSVDNNYLKVYDKFNDEYIHIPAASTTAGVMAATDANAAPWYSPAGQRRGQYFGVTALSYSPTKAERDTLYKAGVNPIANIPGQGILLFGDKTFLNRPSAFDRINVRRLFLVAERAIATAARNVMFEFNDEFTRAEFVNIVEPFLREIQGRRGITDFKVICDSTNNSASVVDRNEFIANIFIKPARSINYVTLNFVAVRTGVEFEEVVGTV
ncbi:phage tail sheath subtilisin-like domain-containing protein [Gammaproteobacteria bacterium]|nr:phage tail sheath subtilisin-like domain-containing protein [Gammaproteobacteria bacterium]